MKNDVKPIILKFDAAKIPFKRFISGVKDFFSVLEELTNNIYNTKRAIRWSVKVKSGSNILEAIPEPADFSKYKPAEISNALVEGLRVVKKGVKRPDHFSERALEKMRDLAALSRNEGLQLSVISGKRQQVIGPKISEHLEELLKLTHSDLGTIEGQLNILAKRKGFEVEIQDEISGRLIHCYIPKEMLEEAKDAFTRRVAVSGMIYYRSDGTPVKIEVTSLFRFPFNRELPHHNDVRGILGGVN